MFKCISGASLRTILAPRIAFQIVTHRHRSYLSPPFLLDDHTPRYQLISSLDAAKKRSEAYAHLRNFVTFARGFVAS